MPTYKGNVGHFMQHWTLCELLRIAQAQGVQGLNFIDAHAMAPIAYERTDADCMFDRVRNNLPGQGSVYEHAWHELRQQQQEQEGYPNSAAFVRQVWKQNYSLLLCEKDRQTANEIAFWLRPGEGNLHCGDWRKRFRQFDPPLPKPTEVGLPPDALTLVSFDPNVVSWQSPQIQPEANIYPEDVQLIRDRLARFGGGILLQLPTYSANGNNTQGAVISSVNSVLTAGEFNLAALVVIPRQGNNGFCRDMMTMVYARNVPQAWADQLANLPDRFVRWLRGA